jgi:hypothetical protein
LLRIKVIATLEAPDSPSPRRLERSVVRHPREGATDHLSPGRGARVADVVLDVEVLIVHPDWAFSGGVSTWR